MPVVSRYSCNECDFELPSGWGFYTYAIDNLGQRVVCPHPCEVHTISEVTGLNYSEARKAGRVGVARHCICLQCLGQFDLDLQRDALVCPECSSLQVRSLRELIGQKCPRCKLGLIEEGSFVRWKLDPDWEQLPVPQVVKDLTEFGSAHNFSVAARLLDWWEGDYFSKDQEQKDSAEMKPHWTWCKGLPKLLQDTPALAELVVIRRGRCWFAKGVSSDVRRGTRTTFASTAGMS